MAGLQDFFLKGDNAAELKNLPVFVATRQWIPRGALQVAAAERLIKARPYPRP